MKPKKQQFHPELFQARLDQIIDMKHSLARLAKAIDWERFDKELGVHYVEKVGAPAKATRLMVGLHYLKYAFDESDEGVVERFVENPYWQFFCGFEYFQHTFPIDPSSMTNWRKRIGADGVEALLAELLATAHRMKFLKATTLKRVVIDTTVQEKAIAFPIDARLYYTMREVLVKEAERRGIKLRQSYRRVAKQALQRRHGYAHAKQFKRAAKVTRQLKTMLGRVERDILRKVITIDPPLQSLLDQCRRLLEQEKTDKNKLYSIHAPEVECISKGKSHKRYEFGCKVSFVTSARHNWILAVQALHGNPWDGHTLTGSLEQCERITNHKPDIAYTDRGYRGHNYEGDVEIKVVDLRKTKNLSENAKRWLKRRSAIEPIIGHTKHDHRMVRNFLKGTEGDRLNALLAGCGFNMRKLLAAFLWPAKLAFSNIVVRVITFHRAVEREITSNPQLSMLPTY